MAEDWKDKALGVKHTAKVTEVVDNQLEPIDESKVKMFVKSFAGGFKPNTKRLEIRGKDPNYTYRLVKNDPGNIEYRQEMGFELDTEVESSSLNKVDKRRIVAGTYVVMRRRREITEAHEAYLKKKSREMMRGPREQFKTKAARLGVETVDESREMRAPMSAVVNETD